jgi:hypothetical protein
MMVAPPRKRRPPTEQRRALQLLASIPFGASETIMFARGFKTRTLAGLVRAGLATAERKIVRITDAGSRRLGPPITKFSVELGRRCVARGVASAKLCAASAWRRGN